MVDLRSDELSSRDIADKWGIGKSTVNDHRSKLEPITPATTATLSGKMDLTPNGGEFKDVQTSERITDWTRVFERFDLDPNVFDIVDDTVRASTWQQSKALEDGTRDVVNLFSYSARFTRKVAGAITDADIEAAQKRIRAWKLPQRTPGTGLGAPVAVVVNLADMQLFKPEGGGIDATLERLYDGLENVQNFVQRQRAGGRNINEIALVNNGDPFEGIAGNYANQTHTVQGGLRNQMNAVLDVWEAYARELYPQYDIGQFISVLCNHTQFGRQGGAAKSITGDEDSGGAFLAETLQRTLRGRDAFDHVTYTIPEDEMNVYATIAGVPVGFNHGHKIPGNDASGFEKWLNGQVR